MKENQAKPSMTWEEAGFKSLRVNHHGNGGRLDMPGEIKSPNVSNAKEVAKLLHENGLFCRCAKFSIVILGLDPRTHTVILPNG